MKNLTQKLVSFALVITMSMGVATLPAFAADPDTTYFESNTRYYWTGASGTHDLPSGTKLGNLVAKGINFLSLDLASLQSTLSQIGSTINTTINTNTKPLIDLKTGWGSTLNLYTVPSGYGSSWYAQIVRGLYDIKDLNDSIKSLLYTSTGNQTTIINKLNSGIEILLDPTIEGYLKNSSEQLTTISGINYNIASNSAIIANSTLELIDEYKNTQQISTPIQERSTVTGTLTATSKTTPLLVRFLSRSGNSPYKSLESVNGTLTLYDYFHILNNNLIGVNTALVTTGTSYNYRYYNDDMTTGTRTVASVMDMLMMFSGDMSKFVSRMSYMIADPDTVAAKQANKPQEQSVLDNFTGSGDASASVSDFVGVKDSVSALKTSLSGGASYTQAFNILGGNSDGWSWFTTEVAESMDSTGNGSTRRGSVPVSTPYLDSYYDSIYSVIGINGGIE